ncbi:unnamed protein product [Ixodes persulcatus]
MVRKMCNVSDSPIICYKPQSMGSEPGDKDFMLGIITPQQQLLLAELGTDRIQIDSTRGTNEYDFQLTTLMVVDEFNAGCLFPTSSQTKWIRLQCRNFSRPLKARLEKSIARFLCWTMLQHT